MKYFKAPNTVHNMKHDQMTYLKCVFLPQCNCCAKPILPPHQRLNFFSDYSHPLPCLHCGAVDAHFVKPLSVCYTRDVIQAWP